MIEDMKKSKMKKSRSSIAKFDGKLSEYANSVYTMAQNIDYGNVQLAQAGIQLDYDLVDKLSRLTEELEDYYAKLNDFATEFDTRYIDADYEASAKKSYVPDYMDFSDMVKSIKQTGNHNNVFKR